MACTINASLSGTDGKVIKILNYFIGKGFTPMQACAVCGNVKQESGYNELAVNPKSKAYGLFQYLPKYSKDLQSSPQKGDFDFQLDYTWKKYTAHKRYGDSVKGTPLYRKWHSTELSEFFKQNKGTLDDYVELWMCAFERCGYKEYGLNKRKKEARRVADLYNKYASGSCGKVDYSAIDNESVDTDTEEVVNENGAVVDQSTMQIDCDNLVNVQLSSSNGGEGGESTGGGNSGAGGFSDLVTNPKMKKVLEDTSYFINWGSKTSKCPYPKGSKVPLRPGKYMHKCTYGPTTWYRNAGIDLRWWCGDYHTADYACVRRRMHSYGFYLAMHADFEEAKAWPTSLFRPGDCAALLPQTSAHGLMWTGKDWRSDCIETNICSAYSRTKHGRAGNHSVTVWRRRDCQEPGKENDPELD